MEVGGGIGSVDHRPAERKIGDIEGGGRRALLERFCCVRTVKIGCCAAPDQFSTAWIG